MEQLVGYHRDGDIGVITVNNPPVNALSHKVRQGILDALQQGLDDTDAKALVLGCTGRTFLAGADITEFGKPPKDPGLPEVVATLERSEKIIVAALFGTTLGGGFEVAMGCHYRIAATSSKVGLPEVKLGILPGASGTQRLPRLVGVQSALHAMVSGNPLPAPLAHKQGAIDEVTDNEVLPAAIEYARSLCESGGLPRRISELSVPDHDANVLDEFAKATAKQTRGYFAPSRIIQCVKAATELDFSAGLDTERELFLECLNSKESAALRHLFFAERQAARVDNLGAVDELRNIGKVAVIGSGTMGGGIAMNFANRGIPVRLVDVDDESLERGLGIVRSNYERSVKKGKLSEEKLQATMALFQPTLNYDDLRDCDLIIEAVFENMALKKSIFRQLDQVAKPGAILATNTSTLDVDEIAAATNRPQDVLGLHFFSPANIMRLLEVVRGKHTSDQVLATCMKLGKKMGKVAVVSGVCYGFIGNRMLEGYGRETGFLHLEGASAEQIDKAIFDFGFPMGPLTMGDLAGIDVGAKVRAERRDAGLLPDDPRYGVLGDKLAELGRYGQKTGVGTYRYESGSRVPLPDPVVEALAEQEAERLGIQRRTIGNEEIVSRCLLPMINEGARILEEGIAQRASDIDIVWINGYGFPPYRGGPMFYADFLGPETVLKQIRAYGDQLGNDYGYWTPSDLLVDLAKSGRRFGDV